MKTKLLVLCLLLTSTLVVSGCAGLESSAGDNQTAPSEPAEPETPAEQPLPQSQSSNPSSGDKAQVAPLESDPRWILPLLQGYETPRVLSEDDWNKVVEIARTDSNVAEEIRKGNINNEIHWWVGYTGSLGGAYGNPDSLIMSGNITPPTGFRYFPGIKFDYISRTDRSGQIVGVNLDAERVVYSSGWGIELPGRKRP